MKKSLRLLSIFLVFIITLCFFSGCKYQKEKDKSVENKNVINLEEEIIGCWRSTHDDGYYMLFEDEEVYMISFTSGSEGRCTYEIEDDTIIFHYEDGSSSLTNVLIDNNTMSYTTDDGMKIEWKKVDEEELIDKLDKYIIQESIKNNIAGFWAYADNSDNDTIWCFNGSEFTVFSDSKSSGTFNVDGDSITLHYEDGSSSNKISSVKIENDTLSFFSDTGKNIKLKRMSEEDVKERILIKNIYGFWVSAVDTEKEIMLIFSETELMLVVLPEMLRLSGTYSVEGNTISINFDDGPQANFYSVTIENDKLSYVSDSGSKVVMNRVSADEANELLGIQE